MALTSRGDTKDFESETLAYSYDTNVLCDPVQSGVRSQTQENTAPVPTLNQALLLLLIVTVCGILYKKGHEGAVPRHWAGKPRKNFHTKKHSHAVLEAYHVPACRSVEGIELLCCEVPCPETLILLFADEDSEPPEDLEDEIPVVICAAAGRMGATMAAINSVYSNTDANVMFYVVGLRNTLPRIRKWIEHSKLREINFKIVEFNPTVLEGKIRPDSSRPELLQPAASSSSVRFDLSGAGGSCDQGQCDAPEPAEDLNFVRFYLPLLIHQHEKVIYLDDDVIVQGDIQELYDTSLALGHAAAFSDDCDLPAAQDVSRLVGLQNTYMGYLDYRKKTIKDLGISPSTCSFNPGVIVANLTEWKQQRITRQLEKWMKKNVEENLYSSSLGGGVATSPMLIVFHGRHSTINPLWHIRHLGWSPDARYSERFLQEAKLLHWDGRYKPWRLPSVHTDLWQSWFVQDPAGVFRVGHDG
ncbi:Glycosyltransferase 8 domain-containing protein 2 [Fukomys damarensis]|uniref:Glycosyltransferase 8 domain-containing protein 2 n=1 Tax=Fukomys damarensis TaxID=885580 RepID=A0A091DGU4_FUKDA|nr:Glycosyltransferase 8 domain-containing protein 2 [Fukomys damarensis]